MDKMKRARDVVEAYICMAMEDEYVTELQANGTIDDSLFRFWYRFIPSNISALQNDMSNVIYMKIEKDLNQYMGQTFEETYGVKIERATRLSHLLHLADGGGQIRPLIHRKR